MAWHAVSQIDVARDPLLVHLPGPFLMIVPFRDVRGYTERGQFIQAMRTCQAAADPRPPCGRRLVSSLARVP